MFDLISQDKWMLSIYILFTAFLFCLEFLVVILKLSLKETNYERKIALIERIGTERMARIADKDSKGFEAAKHHPEVKKAKKELHRPSPSMFS